MRLSTLGALTLLTACHPETDEHLDDSYLTFGETTSISVEESGVDPESDQEGPELGIELQYITAPIADLTRFEWLCMASTQADDNELTPFQEACPSDPAEELLQDPQVSLWTEIDPLIQGNREAAIECINFTCIQDGHVISGPEDTLKSIKETFGEL